MNPSSFAIDLDKTSEQPLFVQLCDQIRSHLTSGQIDARSRLPASRQLAAEIGVSRSTVVTAFEQLVAEGYIEGRRGSGYYPVVLDEINLPTPGKQELSEPDETTVDTGASPLTHPGYPDHRLFPYRAWARSLARSARTAPEAMIHSDSPFGDASLRRSIAQYLADWRGLKVAPEQVMVTAGSVDALETCIRTLTAPGDIVGLENPGYRPLRNLVSTQGMDIEWLGVGSDGAELPGGLPGCPPTRMVVITPSHQFPLGGAMPVNRRREYLHWAETNDAWIIEDDYDSEFRYAGRPIPALASLDDSTRSIYVGTFSKVFSVSLRLAYLIMPRALIAEFRETLSRYGVKAALPCQRALADFIDSGEFYRHIRRTRRVYAERRKLLLDLLRNDFASYGDFVDHQAGMQIALQLNPGYDDHRIAEQARAVGARVTPLSAYFGGGDPKPGLLLGFCPFDETEIRHNVKQLLRVLQQQTN